MSITQTMSTAYKLAMLTALASDTYKIALYGPTASLDSTTAAYTTVGEITGTGYTAGGLALTVVAPTTSGTTAMLSFLDATWPASTISARGALIYDTTKANLAVCVIDFGATKSTVAKAFTVQMPAIDALNALIRVA